MNYNHSCYRFLYILYIALDSNFKLKGKQWYHKDVELMPVWGAYVLEQDYQTHITNRVDQPKVHAKCSSSHCQLNKHITIDKYM